MDRDLDSLDRPQNALAITEIDLESPRADGLDLRVPAARQEPHLVAALAQQLDDAPAEEPAAAGDQDLQK
jgi:hypothetical protein